MTQAEHDHDLDQPRTLYRLTQEAPASDWSSEKLKPYMEALEVSAKMLAKATAKEAHVTFRGDAVCGAELTGVSPDGLPKCEACIDALIDRIVAHDTEVAHAVKLERLAIVTYLQREQSAYYEDFDDTGESSSQDRGIALDIAWEEIRDGAHHREATK